MKTKNAEKIRQTDTAELNTQLRDMQDQMFRLKFQMTMGQADGMKKYRQMRKDRARMLTILRQRELELEAGKKG